MIAWLARTIAQYTEVREEAALQTINRGLVAGAAAIFCALATVIIAFEPLFGAESLADDFQIGRISPRDVYAPESLTYVSAVDTDQRRQQAASDVATIFDAPDPTVARQQTELAQSILEFMVNIRADPYATDAQKTRAIRQITALDLDETSVQQIIDLATITWSDIESEIIAILERAMRGEIKATDLTQIRSQLPTQVSVRFDDQREINVIVAIVSDLLRPNTTENTATTEQARQQAAANVTEVTRRYEAGQLILAGGARISAADYEALEEFGLLRTEDRLSQEIARAALASVVTLVIIGLYIARFRPSLMAREPRFLSLIAVLFLLGLVGARFGVTGQIYIYPTAGLGLLYVAIVGPEIAIIAMLGLAFLIGVMVGGSLPVTVYFAIGGLIGILTLHHAERLNSYFLAGLMVSVSNVAVIALFNFMPSETTTAADVFSLVMYGLVNGILTAAFAIVALYGVTLLLNLPTALKLVELSQPNQPLLQKLLREAPGTYQHSLQVSNLAEQATNAIGANSELTRVAALYHDIGKMLNPVFFTENQTEGSNPHDTLNDPYRSADIIISHVTEGDNLAKQYRLPNRLRDFIREHHGTSQVYVFYKQAVILAGNNESNVDIADFTYPGPKPQSRETAVMMLADGCEAAVRSRQPKTKAEIEETVQSVIEGRRRAGELDESGLTLNDLKRIQNIFIDVLQGMYHPRINYSEAISRVRGQAPAPRVERPTSAATPESTRRHETQEMSATPATTIHTPPKAMPAVNMPPVRDDSDSDAAPISEVPRLRKAEDHADKLQTSEQESHPAADDMPDTITDDAKQVPEGRGDE